MDEAFAIGARLFDDARFFEAHEAWEAYWLAETEETRRRFLQGLIQIAAGFHKLLDKNAPESAERLFARGLAKLDACPALVAEHGLGPFCASMRDGCAESDGNGGTKSSFDRARLPKLGYAQTQASTRDEP